MHRSSLLEELLHSPYLLELRIIACRYSYTIFAALVFNPVRAPQGIHFVVPKIPKRKYYRSSQKTLEGLISFARCSRKHYEKNAFGISLTKEEVQSSVQACRIHRKEKNSILTERNWKRHIYLKAAIQAALEDIERQSTNTAVHKDYFHLKLGQSQTPFSVVPAHPEPRRKAPNR
ncbi:hypothetical protein [Vibrio maritimus]|uniref:hypothetical protein n=1 Tax=Vibrio maritimus TaxID=990268 RepID=UPI001F41C84F|nr:hypothetical protein [Vibrio maritimus]